MNAERAFDGRVIFDHLEKTAGQSLAAWLARHLGPGCVSPPQAGFKHQALIKQFGGTYSVICGHLIPDSSGLDPRYHYITCLREPVDRAVSWLFFLRGHREDDLGHLWREASQFIESEGDRLGARLSTTLCNPYVEHFARLAHPVNPLDEAKLANAHASIEHYAAIGFFEDLPSFRTDLARLLGFQEQARFERINVNPNRPAIESISSKLIGRLNEITALDRLFYQDLRERRGERARAVSSLFVAGDGGWLPYAGRPDLSAEEEKPAEPFSSPDLDLLYARLEGAESMASGATMQVELSFALHEPMDELIVFVQIFDSSRRRAFGANTSSLNRDLRDIERGTHVVKFMISGVVPPGSYTVEAKFVKGQDDGYRLEFARYTGLAEFQVARPRTKIASGYADTRVEVVHRLTGEDPAALVGDGRGTLLLLETLGDVGVGEAFKLPVRLANHSSQDWAIPGHNPVRMGYRWTAGPGSVEADTVHADEAVIPELPAGSAVDLVLTVAAPSRPGTYLLLVLPLQDGHCWFDAIGFAAGSKPVIIAVSADRKSPD